MKIQVRRVIWILILIGTSASGCHNTTESVSTQELLLPENDSPTSVVSTKEIVMETVEPTTQVTVTKPKSTISPTPNMSSTPASTENTTSTINKYLLINTNNTSISNSEEVWILDPGGSIPRPLLTEELFSYTSPTWSWGGERIAFERHDKSPPYETQIGIVNTEGVMHYLFSDTRFQNIGRLGWSADDQWIIFVSLIPEHGNTPFAIEIETEQVKELHPSSEIHYSRVLMKPSPRSNIVAFVGFYDNPDLRTDIWILSLDSSLAPKYIEFDMPPECGRFTDIEWAPNGTSFLAQPDTVSNQYECWPRFFSYDLLDQEWSEVARAPDEDRSFANLSLLHWSPDGKWLVWFSSSIEEALVYDTNTWDFVGSFEFESSERFLGYPWVQNIVGESILSVVETNYTSDFSAMYVFYGIDPKRTVTDGEKIAEIIPESEWLPEGMESHPFRWQP